jgi:hypothetical protein
MDAYTDFSEDVFRQPLETMMKADGTIELGANSNYSCV